MKVSVIMANYRGGEHLFAAIRSVLRQTHADLELIVSDDASPDDSVSLIRQAAAEDRRVRLIEATVNAGPAAARNRALDVADGEWIAVMDSDDLMHPQRLERLVSAAERHRADIVADDLVFFGVTVATSGQTLLQPLDQRDPLTVSTEVYLRASGERSELPALGYLKPMIRRSRIGALRYAEELRIGEDYDFILRLLLAGARFVVLPDPMYLYRRHSASISHRLSEDAVAAMVAAHDRLASDGADAELLAERRGGLVELLRYEQLLTALRGRNYPQAMAQMVRHPPLLRRLARSVRERLARRSAPTLERTPAVVRLGQTSVSGAMCLPCPAVPSPGDSWSAPPARMAAELSRLQAVHHLSCIADDAAGEWATGLLRDEATVVTGS